VRAAAVDRGGRPGDTDPLLANVEARPCAPPRARTHVTGALYARQSSGRGASGPGSWSPVGAASPLPSGPPARTTPDGSQPDRRQHAAGSWEEQREALLGRRISDLELRVPGSPVERLGPRTQDVPWSRWRRPGRGEPSRSVPTTRMWSAPGSIRSYFSAHSADNSPQTPTPTAPHPTSCELLPTTQLGLSWTRVPSGLSSHSDPGTAPTPRAPVHPEKRKIRTVSHGASSVYDQCARQDSNL
jgi:hypothetical protein